MRFKPLPLPIFDGVIKYIDQEFIFNFNINPGVFFFLTLIDNWDENSENLFKLGHFSTAWKSVL